MMITCMTGGDMCGPMAVVLLSLTAGTWMLAWAKYKGVKNWLATFVGYLTVIGSVLMLACMVMNAPCMKGSASHKGCSTDKRPMPSSMDLPPGHPPVNTDAPAPANP